MAHICEIVVHLLLSQCIVSWDKEIKNAWLLWATTIAKIDIRLKSIQKWQTILDMVTCETVFSLDDTTIRKKKDATWLKNAVDEKVKIALNDKSKVEDILDAFYESLGVDHRYGAIAELKSRSKTLADAIQFTVHTDTNQRGYHEKYLNCSNTPSIREEWISGVGVTTLHHKIDKLKSSDVRNEESEDDILNEQDKGSGYVENEIEEWKKDINDYELNDPLGLDAKRKWYRAHCKSQNCKANCPFPFRAHEFYCFFH